MEWLWSGVEPSRSRWNFEYRASELRIPFRRSGGLRTSSWRGGGFPPAPPLLRFASASELRIPFRRSCGRRAGGGEGSPPHPPLFLAPCFLASQTLVRPTQTFLLGPDPRPTYTNFPFGPRPSSYRDLWARGAHENTLGNVQMRRRTRTLNLAVGLSVQGTLLVEGRKLLGCPAFPFLRGVRGVARRAEVVS